MGRRLHALGLLSYDDALAEANRRKKKAADDLMTDAVPTYQEQISADPELLSLDEQMPVVPQQASSARQIGSSAASMATGLYHVASPYLTPENVGAGVGGALSYFGTKAANAQNMAEAQRAEQIGQDSIQRQMDYNERLANTQIQRRMADARAAGVNPIFALNAQGAASPQGGYIGGQQGDIADPVKAGLNNSMAVKKVAADTEVSKAQADYLKNQAMATKVTSATKIAEFAANHGGKIISGLRWAGRFLVFLFEEFYESC